MNRTRPLLKVVRDILSMGTCEETDIMRQLGLTQEEFEKYRRYLLKHGLASTVTFDGDAAPGLQPTSKGEALLALIGKVEALDITCPAKGNQGAERRIARPSSQARATTIIVSKERLMQIYILEQAEVARLEAQIVNGGDDAGEAELKRRQRRLGVLRKLLAVPHVNE